MPGWYCDESDESIHTGKDIKIPDRMVNRLKAESEGLLEPEEIRHIRKKLRLSQEAAGLLVSGGPEPSKNAKAATCCRTRRSAAPWFFSIMTPRQ